MNNSANSATAQKSAKLEIKKPGSDVYTSAGFFNNKAGNVLLSQEQVQVPSTLEGLTAVFGMGTGVAPPL